MSTRQPLVVEGVGAGITLERGIGPARDAVKPDEVEQPDATDTGEDPETAQEPATADEPKQEEAGQGTAPKKPRKPRAGAAPASDQHAAVAAVVPGPATAPAPVVVPEIPAMPKNAGREIPVLLYGAATGAIGKFMAADRARNDAWEQWCQVVAGLRADPTVTEDAIWRLAARYGIPIPPAPESAPQQQPQAADA